jgi:hypothetical protein
MKGGVLCRKIYGRHNEIGSRFFRGEIALKRKNGTEVE